MRKHEADYSAKKEEINVLSEPSIGGADAPRHKPESGCSSKDANGPQDRRPFVWPFVEAKRADKCRPACEADGRAHYQREALERDLGPAIRQHAAEVVAAGGAGEHHADDASPGEERHTEN